MDNNEKLYPQLAHLSVLLLDDHPARREVTQSRLASYQMQVTSATLEDGVSLHKEAHFHIIIVSADTFDHHIGHLGRTLKILPAFENTLRIFTTSAQQRDYEIEQALLAGYACVLNILEPTRFITKLVNSWQSWSQKNQFSITAPTPAQKGRVLLVEDDVISQKMVKIMLTNHDCVVDVAATGNVALKLLEKNNYALVLMDIGLPDISGLDVTAEFRRRENKARRTPIIALTAHALKDDEAIALAAGMDSYIVKPLDSAQLEQLLAQVS